MSWRREYGSVIGAVLACLVSVSAQNERYQELPQPTSSSAIASYDLSKLELAPSTRAEFEAALGRKDYKAAEAILVEEVNRDPQSFRAGRLLEFAGRIFFLDGQYLNSAIAWKKSEAITPLDEPNRFTLAMAYVKLNRRDWAEAELQKLSAAEPGNALYLYWLSRLDYDNQKYNEAIARLQQVVKIDPGMMRAYDLLGLCYDYLGQLPEAIRNFSRAVELNRAQSAPSPWPNLDMAISQIELNRLPEAEKNLRMAITYDSKLPQAHYELGRVLEKQGKSEEAVKALNDAAALDPSYPDPHYLLGRIYQKQGDAVRANSEIQIFQHLTKARSAPPPPPSTLLR